MKKKVLVRINKKTGLPTISTVGFEGPSCLKATEKLREGLGIDAEPERTPDFYVEETKAEQQEGL